MRTLSEGMDARNAALEAAGFVLGIGVSHLFVAHQLSDMNDQLDRHTTKCPAGRSSPTMPSASDSAGKRHGPAPECWWIWRRRLERVKRVPQSHSLDGEEK